MGQNFIACDRGQVFLMPPSLTDWVPDDHLVWTVLGAVEQMDLDAFFGAYRASGQGRAVYDPAMMVALMLYAYSLGNRSSRGIERACRGDVACTVIAIDGTKVKASASRDRNRSYESIVSEILDEAERIDREEDERHGGDRGDELAERFRSRESRRAAVAEARQRLESDRSGPTADAGEPDVDPGFELDREALAGCGTGAAGRMSIVSETHDRSLALAPSGSRTRSGAWRKNSPSSGRRTRHMTGTWCRQRRAAAGRASASPHAAGAAAGTGQPHRS